jgi:IS30 family transposase
MEKDGLERVSHETIYQMIYSNHQGLGDYQRYLRQGQKQRRRQGIKQKRGGIPGRVGIEHRAAIAGSGLHVVVEAQSFASWAL